MTTELDNVVDTDLINFDMLEDSIASPANPTLASMVGAIDELSEDTVRRMIVVAFQPMSDTQLCQAFQSTDGLSGNPIADLLVIAAEERGLVL